jgi:hypothetical protein
MALCAGLLVLVFASTSGAAARVGIGRMTITPNRVSAGTTNDFSLAYTADSAPLTGTMLVDVPRGWTKPQQGDPAGPGYVELQSAGCVGTRISGIAGRRIVIATQCPRRHLFRLLYNQAVAPQIAADGFVFLTQTRAAGAPKKVPYRPLGPKKQPVVRVRGAGAAGLFMAVTSVATAGVPFGVTVRVVDQYGNNAADYAGTLTLTSSDPAATLPAPYLYGTKEVSQHTFAGTVLHTPGTQTITATDSNGFTITSPPITVASS